jgi:hypothetical protein
MLILFETSTGYAIFRIADKNKLKSAEDISTIFKSEENAAQ